MKFSVPSSVDPVPKKTKMRCHYEVLEIERTATDDEIKKAYRKLALKWHPDKNPDRLEECTKYFPTIQQAYEVLFDSQERAWYDRHREAILKGGLDEHYKDNSLNLFPYFSTACYSGYDDDEKSFYCVYEHVFDTIAQEDIDFIENQTVADIPRFGNAGSSYSDVVGPFYAYWQSYSTSKPYTWLDKYDIQQAPNRRVVRLMEKDNAKIRLAAKKERNDEVRALVDFVHKRDKRVAAYRRLLDDQRLEQKAKVETQRITQKLKNLKAAGEYKDAEWHDADAREDELKEIESHFDDFGPFTNQVKSNRTQDDSDNQDDSSSRPDDYVVHSNDDNDLGDFDDDLYCVACEKMFKTKKSYENHERSKRHKENVELLKSVMAEDELQLLGIDRKIQKSNVVDDKLLHENASDLNLLENPIDIATLTETVQQNVENLTLDCGMGVKIKVKTRKPTGNKPKNDELSEEIRCKTCGETFETRNKLFSHLEESGHAALRMPTSKHETKKKKQK